MGVTGSTTTLQQALNEAYDRIDARKGKDSSALSRRADRISSIWTI